MTKKLTIMVLTFLLVAGLAVRGAGKPQRVKTVREGFGLAGLAGKLSGPDSNDTWFFTFDSDVKSGKGIIKAGRSVEFLKSAALEKLIAETEQHRQATYRIWGKVTKYKNRNFIFGYYFLPISQAEQPESSKSQPQERKPVLNDPNDEITIPDEIMKRLSTRKIIRTEQLRKPLELKQDSVLIDRTGFIETDSEGRLVFTLDGLGRNVPDVSIRLLGCQVLERAQYRQAKELEPLRFEVAGIVTRYKGQHYLLLQRARRSFSYGNFPK